MNNNLIYRNNIDKSKNLLDYNICIELIKKKNDLKLIGEGLNGEVFVASSPKCGSIVIKKTKHKNDEMLKREIIFMNMIKTLILKNICPNYIYMINRTNNLILMEYADGDLNSLYKKENINLDKDFIYNLNFQLLVGLLALQKIIFTVHNDLALKNIFYKKINNDNIKIFEYNINGEKFYIPNNQYLYILSDFGNSQSLLLNRNINWDDNKIINNKLFRNYDFIQLKLTFYKNIEWYISKNHKIMSIDELFKLIDKNDIDTKDYFEKLKNKYENNNKRILQKMIIYALSRDLFNYKQFIDNSDKKYFIYSDEFKDFIDNIYNTEEDIFNIINKYFKNFKNYDKNKYSQNQIKKFDIKYESFN